MNTFRGIMEWVGVGIDASGVLVVSIGALLAAWRFVKPAAGDARFDVRAFR